MMPVSSTWNWRNQRKVMVSSQAFPARRRRSAPFKIVPMWGLYAALLAFNSEPAQADPVPIALTKFQLVAEQGAQAKLEVTPGNGSEPSAAVLTVTKTGPEFWSVELRAPGLNWQTGAHYQLKFRAKATPESYIYLVPEQDSGVQSSVAPGTMLQIPAEWTDCTVSFAVTREGNPGRLTISELSVNPAVFALSDFVLTQE